MAGAPALGAPPGPKDADFHKPIAGGQFLHPVRARACAFEGHGATGGAGDRTGRQRRQRVQPSRWTTASRWATTACFVFCCRRAKSSPIRWNTWSNTHCADALVCISNCDKITPGHADGGAAAETSRRCSCRAGPMEAGKTQARQPQASISRRCDGAGRRSECERRRGRRRSKRSACPTCGSCSGMFTHRTR